jgi:hypothetical protein
MKILQCCVFTLLLVGCQRAFDSQRTAAVTKFEKGSRNSLYFLATDFSSSGTRRFDLEKGTLDPFVLPSLSDGSLGFDFLSRSLIVLNRGAANHLSLSDAGFSKVVRQIPLPLSSNPQDIVVLGNSEAYVSYLHSAKIDRFDLKTGERVMEGIDLSPWSDSDGYPEAAYFYQRKQSVWLTLQRLNNTTYEPAGQSFLIRLDPAKNSVAGVIPLHYPNPLGEIRGYGDSMYVGGTGKLGFTDPVLDGGIEKFGGEPVESQGMVATEESFQGDLLDFCVVGERAGYAIVARPQTDLVYFDPSRRLPPRTVLSGRDFQFSHLLVDEEREIVFVADRNLADPGIRVFDFQGVEQVDRRIKLDLPPLRLLLGP